MWRKKPSSSSICCVDVQLRVPKRLITKSSEIKAKTKTNVEGSKQEWKTLFEQYAAYNNLSSKDWYQLSSNSLDEKLRQLVSKQFGGYLYRALSDLFPETEWKAWKFQHQPVPPNFWKEHSNQRKFFDDLGHQLGIKNLDDWYEMLSKKEIEKHDGAGLLSIHKNSPSTALMAAYPEHNWIPWKFSKVYPGYWNDISNQRKFFDDLGKHLGVEKLDDWYSKLSKKEVIKHGGATMLELYGKSAVSALTSIYSGHTWAPWKFVEGSIGHWQVASNRRKFFDELGKILGVQKLDDWYSKLNSQDITKHGGEGLLSYYNDSPTTALMDIYPEHNWDPWKFPVSPKGLWDSQDNVRKFLNELSEKLAIQTLDDWYRVDRELLSQHGALGLLVRYRGLYNILKEQYPHHPWDRTKFKQIGKKTQRWLAVTLQKMFPNEEILEDYMHPEAVFPTSKRPIQLDIYIPSRSLAFEYQGQQHYQDIGIFSHTASYQVRDEEKRAVCAANNIKLIEVPYWWNRTQESLQEIMQKHGLNHRSI